MKTLPLFLVLLAAGALPGAYAATGDATAHCATTVHHQFDFWIGEWSVTEHGKPASTNRIDRLLDGCALLENWIGSDGSRGHSLNFYDPGRALWQQTWVDSSAGSLNLTGQFSAGHMVLSGQSIDQKTHQPREDRITWTPNADGTVRQLWDQSLDAGKSWQVLFDGIYTRKGK